MKTLLILISIVYLHASQNTTNTTTYFEQKDITQDIDIYSVNFTLLNPNKSNFGFTTSIFWIKVELINDTKLQTKKVLHFPCTQLDYIDIYESVQNRLIIRRETGDLRVYNNDGFLTDPSYFVQLLPKERKTFFIKVQTQGSMYLKLNVLNYDDYVNSGVIKSQILMFYIGAIFIMLIYNFMLYLYIRDRSYLFYVLFHLDYMFFSLAFNGFAFTYFWSSLPYINNFAMPFFISMGSILAVAFTIDFLNVKGNTPKIYKLLRSLILVNIVATILIFILSYRETILIVCLISLISLTVILISSLHSHIYSKNQNAKFFALAWGFLLIGLFIVSLKSLGLLPTNLFTSYAAFIGAFIELVLLSSALAYRYKLQSEEIVKKDLTLLRQSRFASMGEMITNIAHQWRQPLHRIGLSLSVIDSVLQDDSPDRSRIDNKLQSSQDNLQYMSDTIDDFNSYFKVDKFQENFNLYKILKKAKNLLESRLKGIVIKMPKDKIIEVYGYQNEYLQVVLVILNNAIDNFIIKNIERREISLSISSDQDSVYLDISDSGGGIYKNNIDKVFDPYYTTKFRDEGTGIGLYMAKMLIEQSISGELSVRNDVDGASFRIKTDKR